MVNWHLGNFFVRSSGDIVKKLVAENVHVKVIDDLAVGVEMHGVDCVLLGAEGVVETGGKFFLLFKIALLDQFLHLSEIDRKLFYKEN